MPFCIKCGALVSEEMAFCPSCGIRLNAAIPVTQADIYQVVLHGRGAGQADDALYLLEQVLGYTNAQARELLSAIPAPVARGLTLTQAQYIAQAFAEYGMEVFVTDEAGQYVAMDSQASSSIFDLQGNFLPAAAAVLAMLTAANRVRQAVRRHRYGSRPPLFSLGFRRPRPLPPRRRPPHRMPKRPPARKSFLPMKPKAPPPPRGARRPAPPRKPAPPRHTGGPRRPGGPGGGPRR